MPHPLLSPPSYYNNSHRPMHHHATTATITTSPTTTSTSVCSNKRRRCDSQHICYCKLIFVLGLGWVYGILLLVAKKWHMTEDFSPLPARHHQQPQQHITVAAAANRLSTSSTTRQQQQQQQQQQHGAVAAIANTRPIGNLWDESSLIPQWMKDYFVWHEQQRALITPDNWSNFSYLVMQCASFDRKCGGTADRLKPTLMMILLAHQMKRILFIHWQRPVPLEEFLLPPQGGMDWRMPAFLQDEIGAIHSPIKATIKMERMINASNITINVRYQSYTGGASYYDAFKPDGPNFTDVYHDVWKVLFTPHPVVADMVQDQMDRLGLQPNQYASIHLRAHYRVEKAKRAEKYVKEWAPHAVKCASQLLPGGPFFFASDSSYGTHLAQEYGKRQNVIVVAREDNFNTNGSTTTATTNNKRKKRSKADKEPLHLDMANQHKQASDYYDTFVDLYLLALGKCVSFGVGGFGSWALLISSNSSCGIKHFNGNTILPCHWQDGPQVQQRKLPQQEDEQQVTGSAGHKQQRPPLFLPPMPDTAATAVLPKSSLLLSPRHHRRLTEQTTNSSWLTRHGRNTPHTLPKWMSTLILWLWRRASPTK